MFDLVIKNGKIIDGTGKKIYSADIGVLNERIEKIGNIESNKGEKYIDAKGKYITPGFIDMHSHSDCSIFLFPDCESYLRQGITTFIGGNCGDSNAPINNYWMRKFWEYDMWEDIDPFVFYPDTVQPVEKVKEVVLQKTGVEVNWTTFGEYLDEIENKGLGVNMISLLGHSQIRADVMGKNYNRKPTTEEMDKMKEHISEAMENGAWGISFGRDYPPSANADENELLEFLEHVKKYDGFFSIHWKRTGIRKESASRSNKLEGIIEALELSLKSNVKVQVSHLDTGYEIYPSNPNVERMGAKETLKVFDSYINRGVDAAFDVIPGTSGGIVYVPYLIGNFMPWLRQSGSIDHFIKNLKAKDYKNNIRTIINSGKWYGLNPCIDPEWDKKIVITKCDNSEYVDKSINTIASELGINSVDSIFRILEEDSRTMILRLQKSKESVSELLKHERATVCTDTYAFDNKGIYGLGGEIPELMPHPHTYCAFPKYILEYGMDSIEKTIKKITGFPAGFLGIKDRGEIKVGSFADLVVLDIDNLKTNENYIESRKFPDGIEYVVVNGEIVVDSNKYTSIRAGKVLKK
jgi:N-acyl-D-aspartate/D-glutamate deacylase